MLHERILWQYGIPQSHLGTRSDILLAKGVKHNSRHVELDIDIGADAKDWSAVQATEKLKPVETELRRMEEMVAEIVSEMEYLRQREQKLRDTNESTNNRVKWFAFCTMGMLVALGAWQVVYLRAYFRSVNWVVKKRRERIYANFETGRSTLSRLYSDLRFGKHGSDLWVVDLVLNYGCTKWVYNDNQQQR